MCYKSLDCTHSIATTVVQELQTIMWYYYYYNMSSNVEGLYSCLVLITDHYIMFRDTHFAYKREDRCVTSLPYYYVILLRSALYFCRSRKESFLVPTRRRHERESSTALIYPQHRRRRHPNSQIAPTRAPSIVPVKMTLFLASPRNDSHTFFVKA